MTALLDVVLWPPWEELEVWFMVLTIVGTAWWVWLGARK